MAAQSDNRTYPLSHALPPRLSSEDGVLHFRERWSSGCRPVAFIFFALSGFVAFIGRGLSLEGAGQLLIYWGGLFVPFLGIALWLASRRIHWQLGRETIQKRTGFRLRTKQEWSATEVLGVEMVEQFHRGGRFSQLAPGIHLLIRKSGLINLGAHRNCEKVREFGRAVAEFYSDPFAKHARAG